MTITAHPISTNHDTPFHCGESMFETPPARNPFGPIAGYTTWRCSCGFQQDAPVLSAAGKLPAVAEPRIDETRLVAALSQVERLRWELDIATFDLRIAVEDAIQRGASPADIASAIDLGPDEVQSLVSR